MLVIVLSACAALSSCARAPEQKSRFAILPFENLTGDATLNWVQAAAQQIVASDLGYAALAVPAINDAYLGRANRFIHAWFTKRGANLQFAVEIEDSGRRKMIASYETEGTVLASANEISRRIDPQSQAFPTNIAEAVEAWGRGDFEKAVTLDPNFGRAWLNWIDALARSGDQEKAIDAGTRALTHVHDEADHARIELALANLRKDVKAQSAALLNLARLTPDPQILNAAGAAELRARHFSNAVKLYQDAVLVDPESVESSLQLGYALALQGDLDAARAQFEKYGRLPGQEANSLDSIGEAYFMNGKFTDAEKYFLQAHERNAALAAGGDLKKAAYARWLAGDLKGADGIFDRYLDFRAKMRDPQVEWEHASWEYATGRRGQAIGRMQKSALPQAQVQWRVWSGGFKPPTDIAKLREIYDATQPVLDGFIRTFYASALAEAGQKAEAQELVKRWPLPDSAGEAVLQSLVFPKFLELRKTFLP